MAISLAGGDCDGHDPDGRRSSWSLAVLEGTDYEMPREAMCRVGDLSVRQRPPNEYASIGSAEPAMNS
jgi:hypothetical protein